MSPCTRSSAGPRPTEGPDALLDLVVEDLERLQPLDWLTSAIAAGELIGRRPRHRRAHLITGDSRCGRPPALPRR